MQGNQGNRRSTVRGGLLRGASCASLVAAIAGMASTASAQAVAESPGAASTVSEIIITGSHISTGLKSPTPVTEVSQEQLTKAAPATLATQLRQLPALVNTVGPQVYTGVRFGGQSFLNLRGLDPVRTLTLVDGKRFTPTSLLGTVDVNLLPSALISRVDVVTGGASAAYGSDAVAGVVNFIVDGRFEGLKGSAQYGQTNHGDNGEFVASVAGGTSFAGGRGHIVASGEYYQNDGIPGGARAWQRAARYILPNPGGQPDLVVAPDVHSPLTYGGLITSGLGGTPAANAQFKGIMFGPGGVPQPYNFGTLTSSGRQSGGDGLDTGSYQDIERALTRYAFFSRATYDLTDKVTAYGDLLYGESHIDYILGPQSHSGSSGLTIQRDNAFLPSSIRDSMTALGVRSLAFARADSEPGPSREAHQNTTYRLSAGFNARLGDWKWDGYVEHGFDRERLLIYNNEIKANYLLALDAVISPVTGAPVCRSTLTNPTNGCQPFNPFGVGSPSAASLAYVNGALFLRNDISEEVAATNLAGDLVSLWAGPVSVAVGAEFRHERVDSKADPISQANGFRLGNFRSWKGSYDIEEGYVETEVPLLKDAPYAKSVSFNGAVRVTNYSNSGAVTTWKAGLVYEPNDELRLRVTRSRDIRAPNLNELYSPGQRSSASPIDPFKGGAQLLNVDVFVTGNPDLRPEIADTVTGGIVYRPAFARSLSLTVDYYHIALQGLIATVPIQTRLNQCFAGVDLDCAGLVRDSTGTLIRIDQRNINFSSLKAAGFDVEANYQVPLQDWFGAPGNLSLRALANFPTTLRVAAPGVPTVDYVGYSGGVSGPIVSGAGSTPRFTGQTQIGYDLGPWSILAQGRFIGGGKYFNSFAPKTLGLTKVSGAAYLDLNFERKLAVLGGGSVYLNVRNVFDKDPAFDPLPGGEFETNTALYDQQGRMYRVGFRFQY